MALDLLKWNRDETRFVLAGKLLVAEQPASSSSGRGVRFAALHGLLAILGRPNSNYRPDLAHDNSLLFPRNTGIRDGALLLAKEKAGKFVLPRVRTARHLPLAAILELGSQAQWLRMRTASPRGRTRPYARACRA